MKIELLRVHYIPNELKPGILYISEEYGAAVHLCPCGCGSIVRTPLGSTEWSLDVTGNKPSLYPSIGNWLLPCQSHYWITRGKIIWADKWTTEQIVNGRKYEDKKRRAYYDSLGHQKIGTTQSIWHWFKELLKN